MNGIEANNENIKWTKLPGMDKLLEVINYDIIIKDASNYPRQMYEIIPIFYSEISVTNYLISSMITNTNIYDTQSIFAIINILDNIFNTDYQFNNFNKNEIKDKIDYKMIHNSFVAIMNTENSLAIAKYIWFYYKNVDLLSVKHINRVVSDILIPNFFRLFFHWSFQILEIFFYLIL